ncbi:MAG: hypothetical protein IKE40_07260 [Firmicutes bacterium]|nr:hypothetical protein [Bacillota bacterium]
MKWSWKEFLIAMGIRALRTFAQAFAGALTVGALWTEIQWIPALSAAGVAAVYSICMSLVTGLPEVPEAKQKPPAEADENTEENDANG